MSGYPISILFVCTGNICRSPTAEAVFRSAIASRGLTAQFRHDSAGVDSTHVGETPDQRSRATARRQGVEMHDLRARNMRPQDFTDFDLILAMDHSHLRALKRMAPAHTTAEIALYLPYSEQPGTEVPDPYYGTSADFEDVFTMIAAATDGLLAKLTR